MLACASVWRLAKIRTRAVHLNSTSRMTYHCFHLYKLICTLSEIIDVDGGYYRAIGLGNLGLPEERALFCCDVAVLRGVDGLGCVLMAHARMTAPVSIQCHLSKRHGPLVTLSAPHFPEHLACSVPSCS